MTALFRHNLTFGQLSNTRQNNFDFLRLLLASLVICSHSYPLLARSSDEPIKRLTHGQVDGGGLAVDFFFVISGFLISSSWMRSAGWSDYLEKRILRIYPGFVVALLICAFIVAPLGGATFDTYRHHGDIYQFLFRPLLFRQVWNVPGVFRHNPLPGNINGSLWTIRLELFCYLLVPLIGIVGGFRKRIPAIVLFLISLVLYKLWHRPLAFGPFDNLDELPRLACYFMAGVVFYRYRRSIPHSYWLAALSIVAMCLTAHKGLSLTLPIFGSYMLLFFAFNRSFKFYNVARRVDLSYGVYLYAFPIQQLFICRFQHGLTPTTLFLLSLPSSCLLAWLSWHLVEGPALRMKPRRMQPEPRFGLSTGHIAEGAVPQNTSTAFSEVSKHETSH